jgi:hypothetical protein
MSVLHHSLFALLQAAGPPVQLEPVDLSVKTSHSPAVVLQVPRYSPQLPTNGADLRLAFPGKCSDGLLRWRGSMQWKRNYVHSFAVYFCDRL